MRTNLRAGLKAAIAAKDRTAITALRSALAAIDNAEAVPADQTSSVDSVKVDRTAPAGEPPMSDPASDSADGSDNGHIAGGTAGLGAAEAERAQLTEADLRAIVEAEVSERVTAAEEYERLGRGDRAEQLRSEAAVLERHLSTSP